MKVLFLCLYVLVGGRVVVSQSGLDAKNLRTKLMLIDGYDKKVLPLINQRYSVDVYVSFTLLTINDLIEVTETLTTTGYLDISWRDEFLVWNPADYGGIQYYHWPQDDIWKPDVTLRNSVLDYKELGASNLKVLIGHDGRVFWYPFQVFQSTCSVDIKYFPFDVQTCHLIFGAWSYTKQDVFMYSGRDDGLYLDEYEESSLWEIVDSSWSSEEESGEAVIQFTIKIKRKPLYFLLSVVMPIMMLTVLNVFVFILPCESGERAGYAITVFLSLAVFLTIIAQSLPANSESVAIFAIYVIIQTLQSTVTTLVALLTIRLSTKDTEVPSCLVKFTRCIHCIQCNRRRRLARAEPDHPYLYTIRPEYVAGLYRYRSANSYNQTGPSSPIRPVSMRPTERVTWPMAVRALDFVLFIFFVTSLLVSTAVCFVITATSN